jgi:hypothetical protein
VAVSDIKKNDYKFTKRWYTNIDILSLKIALSETLICGFNKPADNYKYFVNIKPLIIKENRPVDA